MRQPDYSRRVVVTGLGVVSPVGNDKTTAWDNLVNGVSGLTRDHQVRHHALSHRKTAGEVRDFDAGAWMDAKAIRRSEPTMWYGVAASKQAVADSGLEITDENREDIGVVYGTGAGGQTLMIENGDVLREKGPARVAPTFIANGLVDSTSGMIAIETGAIGHNICVVTACSTGTNCVGEGAELIRRGDVHTVIAARRRCRCSRWRTPASATCAGWAPRDRASRSRTSAGRSTGRATGSSWARAPGR